MGSEQQTKFKETEIGMIPEDWEFDYLINHLYIKGRIGWKGLQKSEYLKDGEGILIINGTQIQENKMDWSKCERVPEWRYDESPEIQLKVNDIVMTKDGTIGKVAFVDLLPEKSSVASGIFVIRSNSGKIDQKFLFYYFKSPLFKWMIETRKEGSVIPHLYQRDFENFPIVFPKIEEQAAIAKILSSLDAKIELNQKINKTLESIGQTLFKHWFIDFEFPNEEGRPYKSSGGEMVDTELGKIPKGWTVGKLGNFIGLERGLSYKGKGLAESGIPMINLGTMAPHSGFIYEGLKHYSGKYKDRNLVKPGDLVIANTDITQNRVVLGSPAIVPSDLGSDTVLFTHHIYAVRNDSKIPNLFFYQLLQLNEYKNRVKGFATGTTVLALPTDAILDLNFVIPKERIMNKYIHFLNVITNKFNLINMENKSLIQIRDALLPKLMSGQIRVPVEVD
jgi:type I restriction enzyme, S subunit